MRPPYETGQWCSCDAPPDNPGVYEWRCGDASGELLVLPDETWGLAGVADELVSLERWEEAWCRAGYPRGDRGYHWSLPRPTLPPLPAQPWRIPARVDHLNAATYVATLRIDGVEVAHRERLSQAPPGMVLTILQVITRQIAVTTPLRGEPRRVELVMEVR